MMRTRMGGLALIGAILAAACWTLLPTAAEAKGKNKGTKEHKARGKVVSVTADSITIETHKHHKKGAAAANAKPEVATETFQIGPNTIFEAVTGKGQKAQVTLSAVKKGERVTIESKNGPADKVEIADHQHHHHTKMKKPVA